MNVSNAYRIDVSVANSQPVSQLEPSKTNWDIQCVDCPKDISGIRERSLRLDSDGRPHVVYGDDHLYYAWRDGTQWHYETVDEAPGVSAYFISPANSRSVSGSARLLFKENNELE